MSDSKKLPVDAIRFGVDMAVQGFKMERVREAFEKSSDQATDVQLEAACTIAARRYGMSPAEFQIHLGSKDPDVRYAYEQVAVAAKELQTLASFGISSEKALEIVPERYNELSKLDPRIGRLIDDPDILITTSSQSIQHLQHPAFIDKFGLFMYKKEYFEELTTIRELLELPSDKFQAIFDTWSNPPRDEFRRGEEHSLAEFLRESCIKVADIKHMSVEELTQIAEQFKALFNPPAGVRFDTSAFPDPTAFSMQELCSAVFATHGINPPYITIPDPMRISVDKFLTDIERARGTQ